MLKLFKNISIYSFGNILSAFVSFLLLPIYTRLLTPGDYGVLELLNLFAAILGMLFGLIVSNGYGRIYFDTKDEDYRRKLFATGQIFTLLCAVSFTAIIFFNADWFSHTVLNANVGQLPIFLITVSTIFSVMIKIPLANLQIRQLPKQYIVVNLIGFLLTVSATIILVVFYRLGVLGVLYGQLIGNIIQLIFLSIYSRKEYKIGFSLSQLGLMLSFSVFLIPANLSALVLNMSNRWFLQEYHTIGDVGLYALGAKFASIIPMLFTEPIKQAFSPYLYEQLENPEKLKKTLADFSRHFLIGLSVVVLGISLMTREAIMIIADKSFYGSQNVTFILSVSFLFLGLAGIVVQGIQVVKKTWIITLIWVFSSLVNILLNFWLVPLYGRMGAAVATLISVIIICIFYFIAVAKVYPVKFNYSTFVILLFLTVIFNYAGSLINYGIVSSVLMKFLLLGGYIVSLFLFKILSKEEIFLLKELVIKAQNKALTSK
jgi:O-antigen/teichoic acid export membrane protein